MKVGDGLPLTIFARSSILDVWLGSKYVCLKQLCVLETSDEQRYLGDSNI